MQGLRERTEFSEFSSPEPSRGWLSIGLRLLPVVLLAVIGVLVLTARANEGMTVESIGPEREDGDRSPGGEPGLADPAPDVTALPALTYDRGRPQLFVQGTAGQADLAGQEPSEPGATAPSDSTTVGADARATATTDADDTATTAASGTATTDSRGTATTAARVTATTAARDAVTADARGAVTTAASGRTTTGAKATTTRVPTTRSSATSRPSSSAPATTARPTTAAPTTARPTTTVPTTARPTTAAPTTAGGNCAGNAEFERIFRDDFNGSSLSGSWSQFNSAGNSNYGLRRSSANSVSNGKLAITAKMENGALVSGGMSNSIDQKYGKWVIRVRTDNDPSQAVSGVVLTWPQSGVHPRDGENNIYETLVKTPNRNPFFTFIHKPFGTKSDQEYYKHTADGAQFQVMTMEWTPDRITIIREGPGGAASRDVWTVNETSANLIPDVPHHLSIQLDAWKHSIANPVRMEVDFVEIHKYCG